MAKQYFPTSEGIMVASKTYNCCTKILCEQLGMDPPGPGLGLGPKGTYEVAVAKGIERLTRKIKQRYAKPKTNQTTDDISRSQAFNAISTVAQELSAADKTRFGEAGYIRLVNDNLQRRFGLKPVERWPNGTKPFRYRWIEWHLDAFLKKPNDVIKRSKKDPRFLIIL